MAYDIWVDFQRMLDDGHLLARTRNARPGFTKSTRVAPLNP